MTFPLLEELTLNAWPSLPSMVYDGWVLNTRLGFRVVSSLVPRQGLGILRSMLAYVCWHWPKSDVDPAVYEGDQRASTSR